MALKRSREAERAAPLPASKKAKIDPTLARIWEALADEDENTRLEGAYELLQNHCQQCDLEDARRIAKRLFRGLCSGRKNARQGFYVALAGALSIKPHAFGCSDLRLSEIVSILEAQSAPESETTGQDERDHHFGRLLGIKALLHAEILITKSGVWMPEWNKVLDDIYTLMAQKPWLRPEASSIVCTAIRQISLQGIDLDEKAILQALKQLKQHKLVRTVDGLAIWLTAQTYLPNDKLPQDSWNLGDPVHTTNLEALKRVLLDVPALEDADGGAAGKTVWSPTLNKAWYLVIKRLSLSPTSSRVSLEDFWRHVVDGGLFHLSSTAERKLIGFLVLELALKEVDCESVPVCFSANLVSCLIQSLRAGEEAYLQKVAFKVFADLKLYSESDRSQRLGQVIKGLVLGCDLADFDVLTATKIVQSLFDLVEINREDGIIRDLLSWLEQLPVPDKDLTKASRKRKSLLSILQRSVCQSIRTANQSEQNTVQKTVVSEQSARIAQTLIRLKHGVQGTSMPQSPFDESTIDFCREKIHLILEALLASGVEGQLAFLDAVSSLKDVELEAESAIMEHLTTSWRMFKKSVKAYKRTLGQRDSGHRHPRSQVSEPIHGLAILLGSLLLQVYDSDADSTEMLEEVNSMAADVLEGENEVRVANHAIEIVLSLVSKSSKFLRRAGGLAFEAFTDHMSSAGLEALANVLSSKEGRSGQEELFEDGDAQMDGVSEGGSATDDDSIDSDVEVVEEVGHDRGSVFSDEDSIRSDVESDQKKSDTDERSSDSDDEELANFEGALAAALGTRKLNSDDLEHGYGSSDSDSDSDMSDSQMIELDEKLAEVFKHQHSQLSSQRIRKEEMKNAKENVVNLKNRALDLSESFLRLQQARGLECIDLLVTLLRLAIMTDTPQLAHRALEITKTFSQKSKGTKLPTIAQHTDSRTRLITNLRVVQFLANDKMASNAVVEAASRIHILVCKLLVSAGQKNIDELVQRNGSKEASKLEGRKSLQEFWKQYDIWAATLQLKKKNSPTQNHVNGNASKSSKQKSRLKKPDHRKRKASD